MKTIDRDKLRSLSEIMGRVHALADHAWPRDASGVSATMPRDAIGLICDIQAQASKALGLPDDLDLMTGNPLVDL